MRDRQIVLKHKRVDKVKAIAMVQGGMSKTAVAKEFGVTRHAIGKLIQRTQDNKTTLDQYRDSKPEIFEQIQAELLSAVSADDCKQAQSLVTSAAILQDKIQVMRGQANNIMGIADLRSLTQLLDVTPSIDDSIDDAITS